MNKLWILVACFCVVFIILFSRFYEGGEHSKQEYYSEVGIEIQTDLYNAVIKAVNDNQIQAARDLVSLTDSVNPVYDAIRNNKIQKARNIIKYLENDK